MRGFTLYTLLADFIEITFLTTFCLALKLKKKKLKRAFFFTYYWGRNFGGPSLILMFIAFFMVWYYLDTILPFAIHYPRWGKLLVTISSLFVFYVGLYLVGQGCFEDETKTSITTVNGMQVEGINRLYGAGIMLGAVIILLLDLIYPYGVVKIARFNW